MKRTIIKDTLKKEGKEVLLKGWVHNRRNLGKLIFVDLRDYSGLIQVVFLSNNKELLKLADSLKSEYVVAIKGVVNKRPPKLVNPKIATGGIELQATNLEIINQSETPPFEINKDTRAVNEELRLKYRYLDLRSERMHKNILLRQKVVKFISDYLTVKDFVEITTPILTRSTPEGARDFIVPSRLHPGKFYALPQSPQQYKQLLMVGGVERYFQIALCMRDEDARADRSPGEFYQLDLEMSFIKQEDLLELMEDLFTKLVKEITPEKHITQVPWPRLKWQEVMDKYGVDKPDLRQNKNDPNELAFVWVLDFPLFETELENGHYAPSHHMFTAPREEDIPLLDTAPGKVKSYQHDLVLNGYEVGGGSIRIHDPAIQSKIFKLIGFSEKKAQEFQHMLEAFKYGAPPHGGIASGIDRLVMILAGEENIREVIAFPKSGDARDVMMDAPSEVEEEQLKELHIKLD